jgi:hypothetical protein
MGQIRKRGDIWWIRYARVGGDHPSQGAAERMGTATARRPPRKERNEIEYVFVGSGE